MARKIVRRLTQVEVVKLGAVLGAHISLIPKINDNDPQLCEYEEGWDDERCAKEVAADLTAVHSYTLRQNLFGKLFVKGSGDDARMEAFERKLESIGGLLNVLITKHDKLVSQLALNRVVDCRHLAMNTTPAKG